MTAPIAIQELADIPPPEPNRSEERMLAFGDTAFVVYQANPFTQTAFTGYALLELRNCRVIVSGGPNDEALHNHPHHRHGLQPYAIQEVLNSHWPQEFANLAHKDGRAKPIDARHFIFAFKEGIIECLARSYVMHGPFPSARDAVIHAANRCP